MDEEGLPVGNIVENDFVEITVGLIVRKLSGAFVAAIDGIRVGEMVGGYNEKQSVKDPNCTSNPLGPPSFCTTKVIDITAPKLVTVKDD
eukprot:CAMPEP_0170115580 /NCGR_PEP_ID=MMETSP0020_2-20130122/11602_1 /TAXON_ID=98059 /ORGANISM="Dinobryon sp., Strain UTEXLB2267" /LENGTH=88 /DNA_ID=CAMNT_0010343221 /DNA_START=448 /DNA_END=711 /DNA_ORIENTATION=-